jgi:hypothetical protein
MFDATSTRPMCGKMGVGIQFSAPYAHHMLWLNAVERPLHTLKDSAFAMMHNIPVPNKMRSHRSCVPAQPRF